MRVHGERLIRMRAQAQYAAIDHANCRATMDRSGRPLPLPRAQDTLETSDTRTALDMARAASSALQRARA